MLGVRQRSLGDETTRSVVRVVRVVSVVMVVMVVTAKWAWWPTRCATVTHLGSLVTGTLPNSLI